MAGRIFQRTEGASWTVVVDIGRDPQTGKRRQHSRTIKGPKRNAEAYLRKIQNELEGGIEPNAGRTKLADYLAEWLDQQVALNHRATSAVTARRNVRLYINPYLGGYELSKLSATRIQAWITDLKNKGGVGGRPLSNAAVRRIYTDLHSALGNAVAKGKLRRNPMSGVTAPKVDHPVIEVYSKDEAKCLLQAARGHPHGTIVQLALDTGMRRSELLGLKWSRVDFNERGTCVIHVDETANRAEGKWVYGPPKSAKSDRRIPVGRRATRALLDWKAALVARHGQLPERVLPGPNGAPISHTVVRRTLRTVCRTAGVGPHSFHALRHTHATLLLLENVHVKIVSERLGHFDVAFTLRTYAHFLPSLHEEAAHVIDDVLHKELNVSPDYDELPEL